MAAMLLTDSGLLDDIESVAHVGLTASQKMAGLITISVAFCLAAVSIWALRPLFRSPVA